MVHKLMYLAQAVVLAIVSWCLVDQYNRASRPLEEAFWMGIEPIGLEEVMTQQNTMRQLAEHPDGGAITYFSKIYVPSRILGLRIQATLRNRFIATEDPGWAGLKRLQELAVCNYGSCIVPVAHANYTKLYGDGMLAASKQFEKADGFAIPSPEHPDSLPYWRVWYGISLVLAFMFFVVRTDEKGLTVWIELFQPQMALAVAAWPVFMWMYPSYSPVQQLRWAKRYVSFIFSFLLSAGGAWAAPKGKDETKRDRKGTWGLAVDLRASKALEKDPKPAGQLRVTVTNPRGFILETITVVRSGGYGFNSTVLGVPIVRPPGKFLILAVAGAANDTRGVHSILGGIQIYGGSKTWGVAIPTLGVEQAVAPTHTTAFSNGGWIFVRPTPHIRMGIRYGFTKAQGRPVAWSAGLFVARTWGRTLHLVESSVVGYHAGRWEGRLVESF